MLGTALAIIGVIWTLVLWALCLYGVYLAITTYSDKRRAYVPLSDDTPGVTIIRPLSGLECNLYENLESSFLQKYPKFEIIFSVATENDSAVPIARKLIQTYPSVKAQLIIGQDVVGVNPKINNLVRPYKAAQHDILWVLDSNIICDQRALARAVPLLLQDQVGLVHHVPFAMYPDANLGARIEQSFLCTTHAKMYLAINGLKVDSCVMGKSTLWRRSDLDEAARRQQNNRNQPNPSPSLDNPQQPQQPGIVFFSSFLGEDNMIGSAIWHAVKKKHVIAPDVAGNTVGSMEVESYVWRRIRWIRIRKFMTTAATLLEPFTECFLSAFVAVLSLRHLHWINHPWLFLFVYIVSWFIMDCVVFLSLARVAPQHEIHAPGHYDGLGIPFFIAWLIREALALPIWIFAMLGTQISWRDASVRYRVKPNGTVEIVDKKESTSKIDDLLQNLLLKIRPSNSRYHLLE